MRTTTTLLSLALLLAPSVLAGSPSGPELTDAAGDAPAPLDVRSAWWSVEPAPAATHADVPDTGVGRADNLVAARLPAGDRVSVTVKLGDALLTQPLAGAGQPLRYYYGFRFTASNAAPVNVVCWIGYADLLVGLGNVPSYDGYNELTRVGLHCAIPDDGVPGAPYAVDGSIDRAAGTLKLVVIEQDAAIEPGVSFSGLAVETSVVVFSAAQAKLVKQTADQAGPGATFVA